jgi:hypothetical protein
MGRTAYGGGPEQRLRWPATRAREHDAPGDNPDERGGTGCRDATPTQDDDHEPHPGRSGAGGRSCRPEPLAAFTESTTRAGRRAARSHSPPPTRSSSPTHATEIALRWQQTTKCRLDRRPDGRASGCRRRTSIGGRDRDRSQGPRPSELDGRAQVGRDELVNLTRSGSAGSCSRCRRRRRRRVHDQGGSSRGDVPALWSSSRRLLPAATSDSRESGPLLWSPPRSSYCWWCPGDLPGRQAPRPTETRSLQAVTPARPRASSRI